MLKYWLSVLLIGITLILVACSESPTSSGGVVMSKGEGGGQITINVEQTGGHGAIELYLASDLTNTRIAVAEGQCTGPDSCNDSIQVPYASTADGIRVVWSAKHLGQKDYYLASAYTCSPGSKGCTSNRYTRCQGGADVDDVGRSFGQCSRTFKVEPTAGSITIGGSFTTQQPTDGQGGVDYCFVGEPYGAFVQGGVQSGSTDCQKAVNDYETICTAATGVDENGQPGAIRLGPLYGRLCFEAIFAPDHTFVATLPQDLTRAVNAIASACGPPTAITDGELCAARQQR